MKRQRQATISRLVEAGGFHSQAELAERLAGEGFEVSQSTLSRDLREMGLVKVHEGAGPPNYATPARVNNPEKSDALFKRLAPQFLLSVEATGNLVVARTPIGNAQGLAAALDAAGMKGIAGTVAGDDTVLVVCSKGQSSARMAGLLMRYAKGRE